MEPSVKAPTLPSFPAAAAVPFARFNNRYAGRGCHIVGRGRTTFDYAELAHIDEPVFFINDAVCLERHVPGETFFFAHDPQLAVWLDGQIRSTAVLPVGGKLFESDRPLHHAGPVVLYRWRTSPVDHVLKLTRDELARTRELYTHTGTIHSALHFAWYCGFRRVTLIGCDGLPTGHDPRLENRSGSTPGNYTPIAMTQHLITALFGFDAIYRGTPR